ncbi:uncharacterized protein LOC113128472 isoform X2 [Mastacembelus armatus]|nr:uncharacterized protein LOC113128472 isoform X2 [Mastacembelus armatus]XP_026159611.1 uncharacterized protein LOC113128472 isoform X2 [Mastacembelus armatus]
MEDFAPLYRRHYSSNLLTHTRNKHMDPSEHRPLFQRPDDVARAGIVLEGTLPQYLDGIWTHRHLQVTSDFTVESRDAKEVFKGGWGCKTELVLSGCQICTSTQQHCELVDDMCRHITGKSGGKLACWDCPTAFPVYIQHSYTAPVCLATSSLQEQTQWANILRAAMQHQSLVLWCENSPGSRAFLDAVTSLMKLRGKCQTDINPMGSEEEVLVSVLMEEVMSYLKEQVFPRIIVHHSRRKQAWITFLSEVYKTAKRHVTAAVASLKEELLFYHSDVEKQISAGLQQAILLQDHMAHTITEDMCEPILQSLLHTIIPRLNRTLQEVAVPIYDGFASTWEYFLETCDDIIDLGSVKDMEEMVLRPLSGFGADDTRMWQCLDRLELSSEGRAWFQGTWGVHCATWRLLVLKAQNALYKVVHICAVMFWRLVSRYPCFSFDSSQCTAVLCRVKDRVVKHLDAELLALRSQLILEMMLYITLPAFMQSVGEQDLSCYDAMVSSEQVLFMHTDTIFHSTLRDSLASYIQSVMRYSLPQQFVPLPIRPNSPCSSSSGISEQVYDLLSPDDFQQNLCQNSGRSSSQSETLTPSTLSHREDMWAKSEISEKHMLSLLDAVKYIHLTEP